MLTFACSSDVSIMRKDEKSQDTSEITTGNIAIPEFPTILLPIASVLAIMSYNEVRSMLMELVNLI